MKNWEKYEEEIKKYSIGDIGLIKGKIINCSDNATICTECDFYNKDEEYRNISSCYITLTEWLYSDYTELKPTITSKEKAFLETIDEESAFIARDANETLHVYTEMPIKKEFDWFYGEFTKLKGYLFPFITWEDIEPWSVEELLKLEVKDEL